MAADPLVLISYYSRKGYWNHVSTTCAENLRTRAGDQTLLFWKALAVVKQGDLTVGIRDLESMREGRRDLVLAAPAALIYAHKQCKLVDQEAIEEAQALLDVNEHTASERALLLAAQACIFVNQLELARRYTQKLLDANANNLAAHVVAGWVALEGSTDAALSRASQQFDQALSATGRKDLDALLGRAALCERQKKLTSALDAINQVVISHPFPPAVAEKARIQLAMGDWDNAFDNLSRVLNTDHTQLDALLMLCIHLLARQGKAKDAAARAADLFRAMEVKEPRNAQLYTKAARVIARLSGGNQAVLQQAMALIDRARSIQPESSQVMTEYAAIQATLGKWTDALSSYQNAMRLDSGNAAALNGVIKCYLVMGNLDDAEQQLEFLQEIQQHIGRTADLTHLSALLALRRNRDQMRAVQWLREAIDASVQAAETLPIPELLDVLNPTFCCDVALDALSVLPTEPPEAGDQPSEDAIRLATSLEQVTKYVPGCIQALVLLGRARLSAGLLDQAELALTSAQRLDETRSEIALTLAAVYLAQGRGQQCDQALEQGLASDFTVREMPAYHLLRARRVASVGKHDEAQRIVDAALQLPSMRRTAAARKSKTLGSDSERAGLVIELARAYTAQGMRVEAAKVMADATRDFQGTAEEGRISIVHAELLVAAGDVDPALTILKEITKDKPHFMRARALMARIYLNHKHDKRAYAATFEELAQMNKSPHTFVLLGEALMRVMEPERAIGAYEAALAARPDDPELAARIGRALVAAHDYKRAIQYYEAALRQAPTASLQMDLARLCMRLRDFDKALLVLNDGLEQRQGVEDVRGLIELVSLYRLYADVHAAAGAHDRSVDGLLRAREAQAGVLMRTKHEQPDLAREQKLVAAALCIALANKHEAARQGDRAIAFFHEALSHDDSNANAMLALARLHLQRGEVDQCEQQCMSLMRLDAGNEEASIMLADLLFRKKDYGGAIRHFTQLLERKPNHWTALRMLLRLLRKAGRLSDAPKFMKLAEAAPHANLEAGLHFCKGLYNRFVNKPREAIQEFNMARQDGDWGEQSVVNMVEIFLQDALWGDDTVESTSRQEAVASAQKMLQALPAHSVAVKLQCLDAFALLATRTKAGLEKGLRDFTSILTRDQNCVPALLGAATANILMKKAPKARNHLKIVAKQTPQMDEADDFERCWLLLADIYISGGKYDLAQELLKKTLEQNQSCARAWELWGMILEKEAAYKDAAEKYENAWRHMNESAPAVGFRLAFNYLKDRRYIPAIDVCHKVLAANPQYPKIKKEIMDKARIELRPDAVAHKTNTQRM